MGLNRSAITARLRKLLSIVIVLAALCISISLMIIGLWEMGYAVAKWFTAHDFNGLMTDVLHGLDFVLLSPLVYLSATGVILYVKAELEQKDVEESFGR